MSTTKQYIKACDAAEAAIREGLRLAPNDAERGLWEAMLDRVALAGRGWKAKPATAAEVRSLLGRAGMTQVAAAKALNVDPRTMRRYVLGERPIPDALLGRLERLAEEGGRNA